MPASITTVAFEGTEARKVDVQVQFAPGRPVFNVVGLGDKAVGEARERVRAAFAAMGLGLPGRRIIINLAPADLPKEGSHYDLPIALAMLAAMVRTAAAAMMDFLNMACLRIWSFGSVWFQGRGIASTGIRFSACALNRT